MATTMKAFLGSLRKFSSFANIQTVRQAVFAYRNRIYTRNQWHNIRDQKCKGKWTLPFVGTYGMIRGVVFAGRMEDDSKYYIKLAAIAQKQGNLNDAENYYHLALHKADDEFKNRTLRIKEYRLLKIYIYDAMANMAYGNSEYGKAEKIFKDVLRGLLEVGYKETDLPFLEVSVKLANIYTIMKKDVEAISGYEFVISSVEKKIKNETEDFVTDKENCYGMLGIACENFAKYLTVLKRYEEAEPLLVKAENISKEYLGEEHPQRIQLLSDLATVQLKRKDYTLAEKTFLDAIKLAEQTQNPNLAIIHCNLGAVYMETKDFEKALESCGIAHRLGTKSKNNVIIKNANTCMDNARSLLKKQIFT